MSELAVMSSVLNVAAGFSVNAGRGREDMFKTARTLLNGIDQSAIAPASKAAIGTSLDVMGAASDTLKAPALAANTPKVVSGRFHSVGLSSSGPAFN